MIDHICAKCGQEGFHYDDKLRGFTCQFVNGKKVILFDANGNERVD